jgi:arginine decarboxylase-like protein
MLETTIPDRTRFETESSIPANNSLLTTLLNRLVLDNIIPYLPISSLLSLASTNREFRSLVCDSPGVFRHLDLTRVKTAQFDIDAIDHGGEVWRNVQVDENLTEDE